MAIVKQLEILNQGVEIWNQWREDNPDTKIDLYKANFRNANMAYANFSNAYLLDVNFDNANLKDANFTDAFLVRAHFCGADLSRADLTRATLRESDLSKAILVESNFKAANLQAAIIKEADFQKASLGGANFNGAIFIGANLFGADLSGADLIGTNLTKANLHKANLHTADLRFTNLSETNFSGVQLGYTVLGFTDLSEVLDLNGVKHYGPSNIGHETLANSKAQIPQAFLRGCGLSDWEIESAKLYDPGLTNSEIDEILYKVHDMRAQQPLQIFPLFISYSHVDSSFVDKMEESLNEKGVRFWRDVHHATAGRLEKQIDRAIRHNPTVLLVLSENSIKSDWVEHEVRSARELEKETGRDVLCPVALDGSWKTSPWPKRIMEQVMEYNILDFSKWEDDAEFGNLFKKLIGGLELF